MRGISSRTDAIAQRMRSRMRRLDYSRRVETVVRNPRPLLGAIRWDAWHGSLSDVGMAVERTLTPPQFRLRPPWFAEITSDGKVSIRGDRLGILEQEFAFARQAGIDYWAFVTYPEEHPLSLPLRRFIECPRKQGLRFCNIVEWERFGGSIEYHRMVRRLVKYFREASYLRVLGDRPLLFLLTHSDQWLVQRWGSVTAFRQVVESLRRVSQRTGAGNPYIAVMYFTAERAEEIRRTVGADALSAYALPGGTVNGAPFAQALEQMKHTWRGMAQRAQTIPLVSWGWDPRPRVVTPVPWHQPGPEHYDTFTPEQCAIAVKEAMDFVRQHRDRCDTDAVIAYAWNEHDEGGWLCPTRAPDGKPDTSRVDAVGNLLRRYRAPA